MAHVLLCWVLVLKIEHCKIEHCKTVVPKILQIKLKLKSAGVMLDIFCGVASLGNNPTRIFKFLSKIKRHLRC